MPKFGDSFDAYRNFEIKSMIVLCLIKKDFGTAKMLLSSFQSSDSKRGNYELLINYCELKQKEEFVRMNEKERNSEFKKMNENVKSSDSQKMNENVNKKSDSEIVNKNSDYENVNKKSDFIKINELKKIQIKMVVENILKYNCIDKTLIFYLIKSGSLSKKDLFRLCDRVVGTDFISRGILRMSKFQLETLSSDELNLMINECDDFSIYQYAINRNLEINFNQGRNYMWYKIIKNVKSSDILKFASQFITDLFDFDEISKLIEMTGLTGHSDFKYNLLIRYMNGETISKEDTHRIIDMYFKEKKDLFTLKIILAILISTKLQENIILAMYLTYKYDRTLSYEPSLIHIFCCRFFMFQSVIKELFYSLEIKTIQRYNMAYLWLDSTIVSSQNVIVHDLSFCHESDIDILKDQAIEFTEAGRIAYAESAIKTVQNLKSHISVKEFYQKKILSTEKTTIFSRILGKPCSYFFDKLTVNHKRITGGFIPSLFTVPDTINIEKIFKNEYFELEDRYFKEYIIGRCQNFQ